MRDLGPVDDPMAATIEIVLAGVLARSLQGPSPGGASFPTPVSEEAEASGLCGMETGVTCEGKRIHGADPVVCECREGGHRSKAGGRLSSESENGPVDLPAAEAERVDLPAGQPERVDLPAAQAERLNRGVP
jgi:hypothetical protein